MKPQEKTMRFKVKFILQSISYILLISAFLSLLVYREFRGLREKSGQESKAKLGVNGLPRWQERVPRSLKAKDYEQEINENDIEESRLFSDQHTPAGPPDDQNNYNVVSTATTKPAIALDDIFISVKTTAAFHRSRLDIIIKTWFNMAPKQTWFFTDSNDPEFQRKTDGHLINTNCSSSHSRKSLCCKMSREFDRFLESNKRWWCHFDDDNYVNIRSLIRTLESYDALEDWYLGRPSIRAPLEILNRDNMSQKISFWFATGGAGFCISRSLALKMMPIAGGGKFISVGEKIRLPDDVTIGYIIEHVLRQKLTLVDEFHSHLEPMRLINLDGLDNQISFGYSSHGGEMNVVSIPGLPERVDPTRMYSLHCRLHPGSLFCSR